MQKPNSPRRRSRRSPSVHVLRVTGISLVVFLAVAAGVLQTSGARNARQNPTGARTYQPTQIPITKFEPLNFAAAAAAEQLSASSEAGEIEEADVPGEKPQFAGNVPINKSAIEAAQSAQAPPSLGTGISPGPSKTFKAEFLSGTTIPPDTMGAVGTTHVITSTNDRLRIQTRDGVEVSRMTISSFWNGVTIKGVAVSAFDTKVYFDRFNNRFIIESSGNGVSVNSGALFAVSATADPTGTWYRWSVVADPASTGAPGGSGNWIDFPSVGFNKDWIVVDENVFHYTCNTTTCSNQSYWGQQVYVLDKQAAYSNTLGTINLFSDPFTNCVSPFDSILGCGFTMAPATTEDNTTDTEYMVEDWDSTAAQLRLSKITGTPSAPALTVGTQFPQSANSWRFDAARIGTANNCGGTCSGGYAPQRQQSANLPSGSRIQTNDSRIQNAVLRNGKLWTVHHVMLSASPQPAGTTIGGTGNPIDNHSGIQWWQIDPTNETTASTPPLQRGRIEDPTANNCHNGLGGTLSTAPCNGTTALQFGTFFAFPNISVNQNEDVLIGFTQMSPLIYPAGAYAMRAAADAPNTTRDVVVFRPGQSNYNIGAGSGTARQDRWGDYSAAQTDPLNDTDFWTVQEYAGTNRNDFLAPSYAGPWETWWAQIQPSAAQPSNSGGLIISEFRLRGPQGARDEFVELYNPASVPLIVQTTDNSDGWALVYSANGTTVTQVFAVVPNGTVIPPHGHFLIADNPDNTAGGTSALTYSLNAAACIQVRGADSDTGWSLDLADNGGIALFNTATTANFGAGTRLDSVGFSSIASGLFKEGNGIPAIAGAPTGQITFYRDLSSGTPKDTGANENDFIFANTVVGETLGSNPRLGAPGPENLNSPLSLSGSTTLPNTLVDSGVGSGSAPNYARDITPVTNGASGTLTVRRSFTNNTGADLTRLRFRVVDITGNPPAVSAADLRVLSATSSVVSLSGGGTANIAASTVETPPTQAAGSGLNGSITIPNVTFASPFTSGSTMNLQFTLGVQVVGNFNFCLVPESLFPSTTPGPLCFSGNTENTPPSITPATLSRNAGDSSSSTIATVSDAQDSAGSLTVTATSVTPGITVTGITNTSGTITATVGADCSLATNAYNVTLQVIDSNGATANGTLVVNVTATPTPPTPTISADTNGTGTQDQACPEVPLTLHANGATGATSYQWYQDNAPIGGANSSSYQATSAATYYVTASNVCGTSSASAGYVVQNPTPHSPFISFRGQDSSVTTLAICQASSQIIDSDSATGIQWYKDGVAIPGGNSQSYVATQAGVYSAQLNALGCHSQFGRNVTVVIDAMPPTPTISGDTNGTGTQDQACPEQPLTLHANGATGAQSYTWYSDNAIIPNETTSTLVMTGVGNISVTASNGTCTTPHSATYVVQNPTPHSPFISFRNQASNVTSISFCQGNSQIIDSDSATGIQWYKDGVAIPGAGSQSYTATQSGVYTAQLNALGCHSQFGRNVTVTVNPLPPTPTINPGGPTTFCQGGSVDLTSSSASGNQWRLNGNPIGGATNQTLTVTASGNYTVQVTDGNSCSSTSAPTSVTVNPIPATPTITPTGPITISPGNSVTLTSSSASGNQWYLNGSPIGGATNQTFDATTSGSYTVVVTTNGCSSASSAAVIVNVCLNSPVVANTNDSGAGSLRQAILDACDGSTITFDMNQVVSPITLTSAELVIDKNLTITGPGSNTLTVQRSTANGTPDFGVFTINSGKVVTISGLTISNGKSNSGGGILNGGTLTVNNSIISGNSAVEGGGIFTAGTLTINNSTISGNSSSGGEGGGIRSFAGPNGTTTVTINNSTISGNSTVSAGGGISNSGGNNGTETLTINNSTISGNSANVNGGGIFNFGADFGNSSTATLTITNTTISGNSANTGGGIYNSGGNIGTATLKLGNTIVAGNNPFSPNDINGAVDVSSSFNLIGVDSGMSGISNANNGNQIGTAASPINPMLTPLANHGGPTPTHVLLPGSPAINGGNPAFAPPPTTDQRGFSRVAGGLIDIGSVEVAYAINATAGTPQSVPINTAFPTQTQATVTESGNLIGGATVTFTAPGSGASGTFTGNLTTVIVASDMNGVATAPVFTANGIAGGPYNVVASLAGNLGSANFDLTNSKGDQTITFGSIANRTFGDADFSVSANASSGLPVSFGAAGNCTVSSPSPGTVHITGAGSCTITASQAGNSNYNPAPSVVRSFNIATASTVTVVTSSSNPSDLNQNVTFTATVSSSAGTPTGTVQFKDNGANLGVAVALNSGGVAQFSTSTLTAGTHIITADYAGSANFSGSSGTLAGGQVVRPQPLLSINDVSITEGDSGTQTMNFTVTLSAASNLPVTVSFATADQTATAPSDYAATSGTLTFNPGQTTQPIGVTINGDVNFEMDETFTVTLSGAVNAGISKSVGIGTIKNDDPLGGVISLSQTNYSVTEATGFVTVTINRSKDARNPVTVDYATDDTGAPLNCGTLNSGLATSRCDYTPMFGTMQFAANETQKTIDIPINRDGFAEGLEVFKFNLTNPTGGAVLGLIPSSLVTISDSGIPGANAIDDTDLFVRQQYHDFLNREPDAPGLAFWIDNINKCSDPLRLPPGQTVAQCIETQRIITSAAFFLSIEFRQTGGLVRDFYVAALNRPATDNMPNFVEFTRDTQAAQRGVTVGQGNWQTQLAMNRLAFMNDFVMRGEFVGLYPTSDTPTQYVDKLYLHANVTPGSAQERSDAIAEFGGAATAADPGARGRALLRITQNAAFQARELNRGFVQMQYFGYLRRNPNDPPDNNFTGYDFWVDKLDQFNGDFLKAEMVKAFLSSIEYRGRFGT